MRTQPGIVTFELAETDELILLTENYPNADQDRLEDRLFKHDYQFTIPGDAGSDEMHLTIVQPASDGAYDPNSEDFFPRPVLVFDGEDGFLF